MVKAGVKEQINVLKQVNLFGTYLARVNGRMKREEKENA
jgi:hypothetical protein